MSKNDKRPLKRVEGFTQKVLAHAKRHGSLTQNKEGVYVLRITHGLDGKKLGEPIVVAALSKRKLAMRATGPLLREIKPKRRGAPVMIPVSSSNIQEIGYDERTKNLYIRFHKRSRTIYVYSRVPARIAIGLMNARSHGEYLATYIKDTYDFSTLEGS